MLPLRTILVKPSTEILFTISTKFINDISKRFFQAYNKPTSNHSEDSPNKSTSTERRGGRGGGRRGVHTWARSACGGGDSPMLGGGESPMRGRRERRGRRSCPRPCWLLPPRGRGRGHLRRGLGQGERPLLVASTAARRHLVGRPRKMLCSMPPAATWSEGPTCH